MHSWLGRTPGPRLGCERLDEHSLRNSWRTFDDSRYKIFLHTWQHAAL